MKPDPSKAVYDALTARGFERDRAIAGSIRYRGQLLVDGRSVSVAIEFPSLDFDILPKVILLERESELPGKVAHIENGDRLCYAAPGSLLLDRYHPDASALTVLDLASQTLLDIISDEGAAHIRAEFPQHWLGDRVYVALPLSTSDRAVTLFTVPRSKWLSIHLLGKDETALAYFSAADRAAAKKKSRPAYVLRTGLLDFPPTTKPPSTFADLLNWAATCEPGLDQRVLRAAQTFYKKTPSIFMLGDNGCVGVDLRLPPLLYKSIQRPAGHARFIDTWRGRIPVKRWSGSLMTAEFMLNRNLGQPNLSDHKIVLVGCGTIGSHVAKFLAQSGAGSVKELTLVDHDIFTPGNVGRHLLGPAAIGLSKADACRDELRRLFPHGNFRSVPHNVLSRLDAIEGAGLLVDATGEEAVSLALNEILVRKGQNAPTAIFTWLAGAGAAAQAFLTSPDQAGFACLRCLFPDLGGQRRYWPLRPDAEGVQVAAACGEAAFTPYGVAAPAIAAGLATKLCLDWVKGNLQPRLRTITIDRDATVRIDDCDPEAYEGCPACGSVDFENKLQEC